MLANFEICNNLDLCLSQLHRNSNIALAISREHAYKSKSESNFEFYCLKEEFIYEYALKFLVRKDFCYIKELNKFIQMANSGGLIEKWHSNVQNRTRFVKYEETQFKQMKMINVIGLYCVWWILQILTIISIFWERLVYRMVRSSKSSKFWIISEMAIDPRRYFFLENKWLK